MSAAPARRWDSLASPGARPVRAQREAEPAPGLLERGGMLKAALAILLASTHPPLDLTALARLLGLDVPSSREPQVAKQRPLDWPAQVLGTLVSSTPRFSLAVVFHVPERAVVTLAEGDVLAGAEVVSISRASLLVRTASGLYRVPVDPAGTPPPPPPLARHEPGPPGPAQTFRREQLSLENLSTGARGVPAFIHGELVGIRLIWVSPGSAFDHAGLRRGDVVRRVNGHRLTSSDAMLEAYQETRTAETVELEVYRDDSVMVMSYEIR